MASVLAFRCLIVEFATKRRPGAPATAIAMKFPLPSNLFPRVRFSKHDHDTLRDVCASVVQSTLAQCDAQRHVHETVLAALDRGVDMRSSMSYMQQGRDAQVSPQQEQYYVDSVRWRLLKHRDNIRVYKERSRFQEAQCQQRSEANHLQRVSEPPGLPMMMAIGSVPGEVNDILFGLLNHTPQMARMQASYINDDVVDSQVLATVTQPSAIDPMHTLAVKWCVKRHNGIIRSLVRHRDFVFVEATGITTDANGERIGYHVVHSITVPQIRELYEMNVVRAKLSMCCLFRQKRDGVVELFMNGFLNPLGDVSMSSAMASAARSVLSMREVAQCAHMKKLAWEFQRAKPSRQLENRSVDSCEACWKSLKGSLHSKKQCQICQRYLCSQCRVPKKLSFLSPSSSTPVVSQKSALFCACCVYRAMQSSAVELQLHAIASHDSPFAAFDSQTTAMLSPGSFSRSDAAPLSTPLRPARGFSSTSYASSVLSPAAVASHSRGFASRRNTRLSRWFQR